ncbi:hypothetical protein FACS1894110_24610 [Spirochaetia bacterium]|nr:hypothetical protein FACS1894110_24610 [Spirochaetia bacterium]
MADYTFRGVEIHTEAMWSLAHMENVLNFMEKYGMNGLIFHENGIIDALTWPETVYSTMEMLRRRPVPMAKINAARIYINMIIRYAKEKNIDLFLEAKELSFPDSLIELKGDLQNPDGTVCPTNPYWFFLMESRIRELLHYCPGLGGIIVSLGTHESRISLARNSCSCDRCKNTDAVDWYENLIRAMYKPLSEAGKKLVIRDFSYTAYHQDCLIQASAKVSTDIIVSLKTTAHDFYIPYPTNSRIGHTHGLEQWIEYDVWGQFYGDSIYPASIVEDLRARLRECREKGVSGAYFRTDWEVMNGITVFNSPNLLNLIGAAILTGDLNADLDTIYRSWAENGIPTCLLDGTYGPVSSSPFSLTAWKKLRDFMRRSWDIMRKTHYCRDHNFIENGQVPDHLEKAFEWMIDIHGQDDWSPGASRVLDRTEENIREIFAEKEWAEQELDQAQKELNIPSLGLSERLAGDMEIILRLYKHFVHMAKIATISVFLAQKAIETEDPDDMQKALDTLPPLRDYAGVVEKELGHTHYPHYIYAHLEPSRLLTLAEDIDRRLKHGKT